MSANSNENGAGQAASAVAGALQLPRLPAGGVGFAAWAASVDVALERAGAAGIHRKPMAKEQWQDLADRVDGWREEELSAAIALVTGGAALQGSAATKGADAGGSGGNAQGSAPLAAEAKEARKLVASTVERSRRVFGMLYASLPEELRAQVAHLPQGWAHGLWLWLEAKFQSTEQDSVGELLAQWTTLRQEEDETFDAYRARVNQLRTLLEAAKEKPSARMYAYMLLDRLQARYKPAVLALKAGGQLKDAEAVAWDTVTALINAHERQEQRLGADGGEGSIMAAAARSGGDGSSFQVQRSKRGGGGGDRGSAAAGSSNGCTGGQPRGSRGADRDRRSCFRCGEQGHLAAVCTQPPKQAGADSAKGASSRGAGEQVAAATRASRNRFESLSSDDDDDVDAVGKNSGRPQRTCMTLHAQGQGNVAITDAADPPKVKTFAQAVAQGCAKTATMTTPIATKVVQSLTPKVAPGASKSVAAEQVHAAKMSDISACSRKPRTGKELEAMLSDNSWGWDTMASSCCSGNSALFVSRRECAPVPVKLADHSVVHATHIGSVVLRVATDSGKVLRIELSNVLYHPSFGANLLSGELLTKKLGWQYHSTPEHSYVVTPGGSRITLSTRGRVAVLVGVSSERVCSARLAPATESDAAPDGMTLQDAAVATALVRFHRRLLHCGWTRMMHMLHSDSVLDHGFDLTELTPERLKAAEAQVRQCTACLQGKATRTPFGHRGLDRGTKPCEVLHMDTYFVKALHNGQLVLEYGVAVKDMYSGHIWHALRATKDRISEAVIEIVLQAETQFGCTVKRLRSDGGGEFVNRQMLDDFCAKRGKKLHWTPKKTSQLNGAAERSVRTLKEHTRATLHQAGAPLRMWKYAVAHSTFVWNRTHISADTRMTPYEALRGKKPSLRHIGVFGCDVYRHVPKHERASTLAPNVEPGIYLGHNDAQNAAWVLLLASKKVITSRDVTFRSDSFAFMRAMERGDEGVREAQQLCAEELSAECDDVSDEGTPAQGGHGRQASDEEYVVESIIAQRRRNGRWEYKVRWAGYDASEDSWEPEASVSELAAMDAWLKRHAPAALDEAAPEAVPAAAPAIGEREAPAAPAAPAASAAGPRQSPRLHASSAALRAAPKPAATRAALDDDDGEPQVHMAMSALRQLQLPEEQPDEELAAAAVASGVAALELSTPTTYREAMASPDAPKWRAALEKEMRSCTEQQVWKLVRREDLPRGANVLPCKEVFKVKVDEHGRVIEYKARFTPKGFRQKHGKDFFDTFARTGQYKTLRVALSLVAKWDHELQQFDVPTAFLNAPVDEDIYMELPAGFEQPGMVCKLLKSLYGLKQAPRNWDRMAHKFITSDMAFKATVSDPSLYFKRSRSGRLMMIYRFVDDMQGSHHAEDEAEFAESVAMLQARFNIKQLKTATWMLGMKISRDRKARAITLDQELYVTKALEKFGLEQCRPVSAPEAVGAAHDANPALDVPADAQRYMEMTGTLMYAAISTRPDIAHAVHYLASNMQAPTQRHMQAAERVLRYLAGTKDVGLVFGTRNGDTVGDSRGRRAQVQVDVCAFADADWANDKGDRRSITGWVAKLNGDPVSWSSKKQRVVALSTCEAELYAEAAAIQEVLWLRGLMEELGLHTQTGSTVFGDNQSAIAVSENGVKGERTKHVDVKYHFVTETVERGAVKLRWVPTAQQQADIFTKALAAPVFELLRHQLMTR